MIYNVYKAILKQYLKSETIILFFDLYFNKKVADFEQKIKVIKNYFNSNNKIITDKKNNKKGIKHYRISITGPDSRIKIRNHLSLYPLLGNKNISYCN